MGDPEASQTNEKRDRKPSKLNEGELEEQIHAHKQSRAGYCAQVTKILKQITTLTANPDNLDKVTSFYIRLKKAIGDLETSHTAYTNLDITEDERNRANEQMNTILESKIEILHWIQTNEQAKEVDETDNECDIDTLQTFLNALKISNEQVVKMQKEAFKDLTTAMSMPKPEVMTFNGDPKTYYRFMSSFEAGVKCVKDPQIKLNYLIQQCQGEAKDSIQDCIIMDHQEGFDNALKILKDRYGRPHTVARAYLTQLTEGPPLKPSDHNGLTNLSLEMNRCNLTLQRMGYAAELNNSDSLLRITRRLPMHLRAKWVDKADEIIQESTEPTFTDLAKFIEAKARVANTMFGQDLYASMTETKTQTPNQPTYLTYGTAPTCAICGDKHVTWKCTDLQKMEYDQRKHTTRAKGLCDNCLFGGHDSKSCPKRKFCNIEGCMSAWKHTAILHPPINTSLSEDDTSSLSTEGLVNTPINTPLPQNNRSSLATRAGKAVCLKIVPVKVLTAKRSVETYAVLDNCSDVTLCSNSLLTRLGISGKKTSFTMNTVNDQNRLRKGVEIDLGIASMDGTEKVKLPKVWSVDHLPISLKNIATQKDLFQWPHLQDVQLPLANVSEVGLLIGGDVPEVFWCLEERRGKRGQPYAVKTILGWTVIGPIKTLNTTNDVRYQCTTNFIQADNQNALDKVEKFKKMDFIDPPTMKNGTLVQDQPEIKLFEETIKLVDQNYKVKLPLKNKTLDLKKRLVAETKLKMQKFKLEKNSSLKEKYVERNVVGAQMVLNAPCDMHSLRQQELTWNTNPPGPSHMEVGCGQIIRTTRKILQMLLKEQEVLKEALLTWMTEGEKITSGRPPATLSGDPRDTKPQTQNDPLLLRQNTCAPLEAYGEHDVYIKNQKMVKCV